VDVTPDLVPEEVRVLGALVEKQLTTPQHYPLTLNALAAACSQSSNRWPVVSYGEATVSAALGCLRERGLIRVVHSTSNRAAKYRHVLDEALGLDRPAVATLGVLLLRGPQTVGELRGRTERMHPFESLVEVEEVLEALAGRPDPLVVRLPRQPGQKDARYVHLMSGMPDGPAAAEPVGAEGQAQAPGPDVPALEGRVAALEDEVAELRAGLEELRELFR